MKREIELDFVRGIAILMVLDFHSSKHILFYPFKILGFEHFGWAGVDVFFVLSGFLVGGLLIKEWKLKGRINTKLFLIRRGFKIWPQYYVFILLMLLSGHRPLSQLWGNLLNIQNYVGGVAHTWSLAVEEHAYLILVFFLAVAAKFKIRMRVFFGFLVAFVFAVIALRTSLALRGQDVFPYTHTRIDGILEGVILATLYHYVPETFRRLQSYWWLWITILAAALIDFRLNIHSSIGASVSFDFANAMGIAILMLLYKHRAGRRRSALYRLVAWIGLYSYGIYLWHVSVIDPSVKVAKYLPGWLSPVWVAVVPSLLGIGIGILLTKIVEFPALALRDRLFPRPVDSAVGIPAEIEAISK